MSDYHILDADRFGNRYTVAFHVPVPDIDNEVGYNYRAAIVEWQGGTVVSSVPFIEGAELTQLQNGELFEIVRPYNSNPSELLVDKRDQLDLMFGDIATEAQARLQLVLGYWGYNRDVP